MSSTTGQGLDPVAALALSASAGPDVLATGGSAGIAPTPSAVTSIGNGTSWIFPAFIAVAAFVWLFRK